MKKKILAFALALAMVFCLCACGGGDEEDTVTVTFNTDGGSAINSMAIKKGTTIVKPADPEKDGFTFVKWTLNGSDYDFSVVVDSDITLMAQWKSNVGEDGKDDNTGDTGDNTDTPVVCDSLSFTNSWYWIQINTETDVPYTVSPASCQSKVTFTSSDETIASVDKNTGVVHGNKSGKITLTAKCGDKTATIPVEIRAFGEDITLDVHELKLDYMSLNNYQYVFWAKSTPEYVVDPTLTFTSSNPSVATVDGEGFVEAVYPGHTVITVSDAYGHSDSCDVYVNGIAIDVHIDNNTLTKGEKTRFYVTQFKCYDGLSSVAQITNAVRIDGTAANYIGISSGTSAEEGYLDCFATMNPAGDAYCVFIVDDYTLSSYGRQSELVTFHLH